MIRINLLAAERPTAKKKTAVAPGAFQAYLILALFVGGALLGCAGLWWLKNAEIARAGRQDRGGQEASGRAAGDQDPGGPVPPEEADPGRQGEAHRAAEGPAVGPGAHARRDLEGAARLRLAHEPRPGRRRPELQGREQRPDRRRRLHQQPAAQRLVPPGRPDGQHPERRRGRELRPPGGVPERCARGQSRALRPRPPRSHKGERAMADNPYTKLPIAGQLGVAAVLAGC